MIREVIELSSSNLSKENKPRQDQKKLTLPKKNSKAIKPNVSKFKN